MLSNIYSEFNSILLFFIIYWVNVILTFIAVHAYRNIKDKPVTYESGFMMDPLLKKDLNSYGNLIKRYILIFILYSLILYFIQPAVSTLQDMYAVTYGIVLFSSINNLLKVSSFLLNFIFIREGTTGHIEYKNWYLLYIAAVEDGVCMLTYLILFTISGNPILIGGVIISGILALRNFIFSVKTRRVNHK